jgi:hypothetical protein
MELKRIILTTLAFLSLTKGIAQQPDLLIMWDSGDATLLKDLGKVNIDLKQGKTVKNARIYDIQKDKGKIVYEKDGCLHDKNISAVNAITAVGNSRSAIYFELNEPIIKMNRDLDYLSSYVDFKVSYTAFELRKNKQADIQPTIVKTDITLYHVELGKRTNDTIVKANGEIVVARIIHLTEKELSYKRADLIDGPVYNLPNSPYTEVIKYTNGMKVILKN